MSGELSLIAGSLKASEKDDDKDGPALEATFGYFIISAAVDPEDGAIYVATYDIDKYEGNFRANRLRKIFGGMLIISSPICYSSSYFRNCQHHRETDSSGNTSSRRWKFLHCTISFPYKYYNTQPHSLCW